MVRPGYSSSWLLSSTNCCLLESLAHRRASRLSNPQTPAAQGTPKYDPLEKAQIQSQAVGPRGWGCPCQLVTVGWLPALSES